MSAEGWYRDPFSTHEDRWFSAGLPTALVRDGEVEGQDAPPEPTWAGELERPAGDEDPAAGTGLHHDDERDFEAGRATDVQSITGRDAE
ncbi:hypothetical protein ACXR2U_03820 [Jatrophihabitans sp. YIM 134969]